MTDFRLTPTAPPRPRVTRRGRCSIKCRQAKPSSPCECRCNGANHATAWIPQADEDTLDLFTTTED